MGILVGFAALLGVFVWLCIVLIKAKGPPNNDGF